MPDSAKKRISLRIFKRTLLRLALSAATANMLALGMVPLLNAKTSIMTMDADADNPPAVQLTISQTSISFASANPGSTQSVPATQNPVSVTASCSVPAALTISAGGDLVSGASDAISISNVSWTVTGDGFVSGTMSKQSPQAAGSWQGGDNTGLFSFFFANSCSYAAGNYSASAAFTLTAP